MSRIRSEVVADENHVWKVSESYTNGRGGCASLPGPPYVVSNTTSGYRKKYHTRTMTDEVIPDYHKLSRQGHIFNNPMSSYEHIEERTPLTYFRSLGTEKYGCVPPRWYPYIEYTGAGDYDIHDLLYECGLTDYLPIGIDEGEIESLRNQAVSQAWANVSQADILSYVAIIEIGKTVMGMKSLLRTAWKIIRAGRKRFRRISKGGSSTAADVSDFYMNLRYNLRPLYYDILGLKKALEPEKNGGRQTYRGQASKFVSDVVTDTVEHVYSPAPFVKVETDFHRSAEVDIAVRAGVLVDWRNSSLSSKLGGWSFASSAWDLVPFSFIVDWFFNVGDTLLSWMPVVGGNVLSSWVTSEVTTTQRTAVGESRSDVVSEAGSSYRFAHCNYNYDGEQTLTTITRVRTPSPERSVIPSFTVNLDALKSLDLGIIVKNLFHETNTARKYRI